MTYQFPQAVREVFAAFAWQAHEIRLVGGCVRDLVLGVQPKDWDMCTPSTPDQVTKVLADAGYKPFDLSNGHGTVSVIIWGDTIEITTLRIDAETDGRHATVEFTTDWAKDAERRDFTWNAMSMDDRGQIYDYFGGMDDLKNNYIRFVGNAEKRIQEDYLRILRYFRFAQRFNMAMSISDLNVIYRNAFGLKVVSSERIWMEMQKILAGDGASYYLKLMNDNRVLDVIGLKLR
jgi:tRNA nucleotidyltransferase/poly(A) polymerase